MYQRFIRFGIRHPILALVLAAAVTAGFATQIPRLEVEADYTTWIPRGDEALDNFYELEEIFGSSYILKVIVIREDHPDGIYNPQTLALIDEITEWLRSRPEIETANNADLRSLSTVNDIRSDGDDMVVEAFMEEVPTTREEALAIKDAIERNGMYHGLVASYDGRAAAIMARESLDARNAESVARGTTYFTIREYLDGLETRGIPEKLYITGRPIVESLFNLYIPEESRRLLPVLLGMLAIFLYLSFRSLRSVLITGLVIIGTEIWMMGSLAVWGHPLYTITSILPSLIVSIAIADSVHLLAKYYDAQEEDPSATRDEVLEATISDMARPVLLTSVTTVIGFLSMTSSALVPLRDFGVVAAFGIVSAYILTMLVIPAMLRLLPLQAPPRLRRAARKGNVSRLDPVLTAPARFADRRPNVISVAFVVLLVVSLSGMLRLTTDSSQVGQFRPGHHLRVADRLDNRYFAGGSILDIMIDGQETDAVKNPALLSAVDEFQSRLEQHHLVRDTFSLAELVKRMNRVMNGDRPEADTIPASQDLVAQYLLLYSISGDPGDFDDLVDYDYQRLHMLAFIPNSGTAVAARVVKDARTIVADLFPPGGPHPAEVRFSGAAFTNARLERYVSRSQLTTIALCAPLLFLLTWMVFKSPILAALCLAPVMLAIAMIYGSMGYIGISTDIATTMLGAMTLGIGIDFSIHYLHRHDSCIAAGMGPASAAVETALTAGRALFYNALVLIGGFAVLVGARLYPQVKLGGLVVATMVICYFATMMLFPAVLGRRHRRLERTAPDSEPEVQDPLERVA